MYTLNNYIKSDIIPEHFTGMAEMLGGSKLWFVNEQLHREDEPAIEWVSGSRFWFVHGTLHRLNGPAREWANGIKEWCIQGIFVTESEHKKLKDI